ncbi:hypothetical protein EJ07DRAFT_158815 [Lizonia empirigonia]|nr:hypothetical protein EJ07DRAFT_158815 [Lizonia empirigonia]
MTPKHLQPALTFILLTSFSLLTLEYIESPMDWVFAPQHDRGLVCPSLRYGCCPDLNTWRHGSPCEHPTATENPEECYQRKEWACCQADDNIFTCTTGFQNGNAQDGWRSGTSEKYLGTGRGAFKEEEQ